MQQIYVQKTVRNAANFPAKYAVFLAYHSGKIWRIFQCFFAGKFAENCLAIFYIFQAFS